MERVEREVVLPAPREKVWAALTEPERLEEWFANDVELDPEPGGEGTFRWADGEVRYAVVEEVELERRFVFTWEDSRVALTLDDDPAGTRLTVVETGPAEWSWALELRACALALAWA